MAVSTIDPNGLNIGQIGGTRNKIINGAMTIDQRNAGAAVTLLLVLLMLIAGRYLHAHWKRAFNTEGK
jgi:hypothetical protein